MCEPEVFDFLPEEADSVMFEREPLQQIAATGNMHAYKHHVLETDGYAERQSRSRKMWAANKAPWKVW